MKTTSKTIAIVGTTAALLGAGAITYAAATDNGPFADGPQRNQLNNRERVTSTYANQHENGPNGPQGSNSQNGPNGASNQNGPSNQNGASNQNGQNGSGQVLTTVGALDESEEASLRFMVEEEKLAHDVYTTLAEKWDAQVFTNIAASEARHVSSVQTLLSTYGVSDPTTGNGVGEFTDPAFDALYAGLVERGSTSLEAALQVGVDIEQLDIADLQTRLATTDEANIENVFQHLLTASGNHLDAFERELAILAGTATAAQQQQHNGSGQHSGSGMGGGMGNGTPQGLGDGSGDCIR